MNKAAEILKRDDGFSLIETLVAVFILSVVSAASLSIMSNFADANQMMSGKINHLDMIDDARSYLRSDLQQVIDRPFVTGLNTENREGTLLRFTRNNSDLSNIDETRSPVETVEYRFDNNKLIRRAFDRPDITEDTPYRDYIILWNLQDVSLKFYDGYIWRENWINGSVNQQEMNLPRAIEISWIVKDGEFRHDYRYRSLFQVGRANEFH